jgi:hypothetical protein
MSSANKNSEKIDVDAYSTIPNETRIESQLATCLRHANKLAAAEMSARLRELLSSFVSQFKTNSETHMGHVVSGCGTAREAVDRPH